MPEAVGLEPRKGMGHGGPVIDGYDHIPVSIPSIDHFKRQLDKIFDDLPLAIIFMTDSRRNGLWSACWQVAADQQCWPRSVFKRANLEM